MPDFGARTGRGGNADIAGDVPLHPSESEKDYDRRATEETLKAIVLLGFRIEKEEQPGLLSGKSWP
jgi:hypothetical protein